MHFILKLQKSLYPAFKPPDGRVPLVPILKLMSIVKVPNGEEKLPKISTGRVGCTNVIDRQTDDRDDRRQTNGR